MSRLVLAPLALALPLFSTPAGDDWPQWRGPNRDGISGEVGWRSEGRAEDLWRVDVGLGYSCVAITEGRLYTLGFDEEMELDVVRSLDAASGEELWAFAFPAKLWDNMHEGGTLTTPAVEGERVFVLSRMGNLFCLDAKDGEVRWERRVDEELGSELGPFGLSASPLVLDELLVVNVGRTVALDKETGETVWQTARNYGYSYGVPVTFELDGRSLLAVFNGAGLAVLERATGKEVALHEWTSQYNVNSATPIVVGNRIFISTGYNEKGCAMLELTEEGLEVLWANRAMNNKMSGCVLVGEHLYGFDDAVLKCLSLEGEELWAERGLGKGALSAADGRLIVLSEDGELLVADASPEGFEELSRTRLFEEGVCWTTPVLSGGRIFARNNKGELVSRDHRGGE
jgi:outer membrane protein assembly factor BamB